LINKEELCNIEKEFVNFGVKHSFCGSFLASAKLGININNSIEYLLKIIIKKLEHFKDEFVKDNSISLEQRSINTIVDIPKKKCC